MNQLENVTSPESLADAIAKAAKLKQWHVFAGTINGKTIEVKAYALWLQIFRIDGINYANPEFKTQKALKEYVIDSITPAIKQCRNIRDYLMKGNGIYSSSKGGRYFDVRVNAAGKLELWDGYESETRTGWIEFESNDTWHGPHGEKVFI